MDAKNKFQEILSKAMARVTDEGGALIAVDRLPLEQQTDDLWIAWALLSCAGAGPFEEQKARIDAWAAEREERFGNVRVMLQKLGIGAHVGPLEAQVAELGAQRDRLRQLADVGAKEIQRLTMQRDAACQGIEMLLAAFEADDLQVRHQAVIIDKGRGHQHMAECARDDSCQCPGRVALLKARLRLAVTKSPEFAERITRMVEGCQKCGHQHAGPELASICIGCPCPEIGATPASGLQGFDPADIVVGAGGQALEDVATAQPKVPMVTEVCEHCTVTPEGLARLGGRLCFHGRLWKVMPDPDAADHDHVFIDGRCACGESVQ